MNKFTKTLLCTAAIACSAISAQAFSLISPAPGSTTTVSSLKSVKLQWDEAEVPYPDEGVTVSLLDATGAKISTGTFDFDMDAWDTYIVTFSPIVSTPGTYTAVIPANIAADYTNPEYRLTYIVEGSSAKPAEPTAVDPEPGSSIVQSVENYVSFDQIRLDFANDVSLEVNENNISFTDDNGNPVPFSVGGWYSANDPQLQYTPYPFVLIMFNDDGNMASGVYTLTCNPGTFTSPQGTYTERFTATYTYTKTKADGDPSPLVIERALMGGCKSLGYNSTTYQYEYEWVSTGAKDVTENMPVAQLVGTNNEEVGTGFLLTFNHGEKSDYVTYSLIDLGTNETLQMSQCIKQADGTFLLPWPTTRDLYEGTTYSLEFHAYTNEYDQVENGNGANLTLTGTTEPYHFSSAKFVTVVPTPDTAIKSVDDNKVTVLFTEPVIATATVNLGSGFSEPADCEPATEGNTYDNVWYVYIPVDILNTYPEVNLVVAARGEDGLVVAGESGWEDTAGNMFSYQLYVRQPRIMLKQTNSHVSEINKFVAYSSKGNAINNAYMDYPYVINEKGERVAEINQQYYTDEWGDKLPYDPIVWSKGDAADSDPLELEFQMTPAITEKGKYTLVFPWGCFSFGTQFDSDTSVPQQMDFYVVDFFPVTYTVDSNTVDLGEVELGNSAHLFVKPGNGWKLGSLTLNGDGVTDKVNSGRYISEPATRAMNFVATFEFDGAVATPSSADEIVTDLNLRGWSEGGNLYVSGLKDGQNISLYTMGGSLIKSVAVSGADTMEFAVPAGVYIATVTEAGKTVALKLINK